ncbi:amino acid permease-domain-containing protein [Mycena polygramma]|nr:amino acid permease-domain-containing protein [Mycena polygramma]
MATVGDPSQPTNYGAVEDGLDATAIPHVGLHRGLSARQVQMIAIAGTIGTGLFLGTGKSLAEGGPASMLICYGLVGFIVYVTLLLLGEMATQYPIAGSFNAYTARFFSPSYAFALSWNYWFNDAVSVASDLTAAQLVLQFWTPSHHTWVVSLVFWIFLVGVNATHVKAYGELEYWLSSLKVATVLIFIILGIFVNIGLNQDHRFIGTSNWRIPGAPFVGGFGGFARVFVTASFAYGGTESLGITAGETKNPSKNMPKVVKFVFWRILLFYVLSILLIGLNVPWDYPNLSNRSTTTSPFTLVFKEAGSTFAASFMNTVILTSVLSAGNHALFAGTRVLYGLSVAKPPQAPKLFAWTTPRGVPIPALLLTSSVSALCFGTSFIGSGELWGWLQNIVGVSNQIAWLSIGLASWRFRKAWIRQGTPLSELKFHTSWTWPYGPPFVIITVLALIIIQGWSSVLPVFSAVDFLSFYIEVPVMIVMYLAWALLNRPSPPRSVETPPSASSSLLPRGTTVTSAGTRWFADLVDFQTVDLNSDQYEEDDTDKLDEEQNRSGALQRLLYWLA